MILYKLCRAKDTFYIAMNKAGKSPDHIITGNLPDILQK